MPRTRSSRVLWLLAESGAPYELTKLAPQERRSAEYLLRHPLGRVPALELDDGTVMFESAAICLQLADLSPDAGLIAPLGSSERALAYQWVLFAMTELEAPLFRWIREAADGESEPPSRERFAQAATALESALAGHEWLLGDGFTVADVGRLAGSAGLRRARRGATGIHRGGSDLKRAARVAARVPGSLGEDRPGVRVHRPCRSARRRGGSRSPSSWGKDLVAMITAG
jgi:glutathione S-transferase